MLAVLLCGGASALYARGNDGQGKQAPAISEVLGFPQTTILNINNMSLWASYDGALERRSGQQVAGVTFPRGTATAVYSGGLVWGGYVRDGSAPVIRVGGQAYRSGTVAGSIAAPGVPYNPDNAVVRVYRIRRDWSSADLRSDAAEVLGRVSSDLTGAEIDAVREQYRKDWMEWPWQLGAPYYDRDGVPGYQPDPDGRVDEDTDEPGLANADQVLWIVCNDLNVAAADQFAGSPPIGLELQITCWAYKQQNELDNVIYQRYRLLYKGTGTTPNTAFIDSMYLAKWVDVDLGDYSDDLAAYQKERGFAYAYNSSADDREYSKFGIAPPAIGYDLVQGPRVMRGGESARWDLRLIPGYMNLPVSSFFYFGNNGPDKEPPGNSYTGTRQWWNILRGYHPLPLAPPQCVIDPVAERCTTFPLSGDPRTLIGWVDGQQLAAADRRFVLSSGPFRLAVGDTQEVIYAVIGAQGGTKQTVLDSLLHNNGRAQDFHLYGFEKYAALPPPEFRVAEFDQRFLLDWESDTAHTRTVESYRSKGYRFHSYRLYQYLFGSLESERRSFPSFDITQPRSLLVSKDLFRDHSLVNGQKYHYGISTVALNSDPAIYQKEIESDIVLHTATPHPPDPGTIYPYAIGDTIPGVVNAVGINDARVHAIYYDPTKATGHRYKVLFHRNDQHMTHPQWDFIDETSGDTLLQGVDVDATPQRFIPHGLTVQVELPYIGFKRIIQTLSRGEPAEDFVFNRPNPGGNYTLVSPGTSQMDSVRGFAQNDQDIEWRFTGDSSWAVMVGKVVTASRWVRVPYTVWQMTRTMNSTTGRQLYSCITDFGSDSVWNAVIPTDKTFAGKSLRVFYPVSALVDSTRSAGVEIGATYYDDIPTRPEANKVRSYMWANSYYRSEIFGLWKVYLADLDNDGVPAAPGTVIRFERFKTIRNGDEKALTPEAITYHNPTAARGEIEKINVFPNPYYGMNRAEASRFNKFVTFNHLPRKATIRLFTISGILVKTLSKDNTDQYTEWDLQNEHGLPVASGIYLAHLELGDGEGNDLGTKILKLMIIQENQFLGTEQ